MPRWAGTLLLAATLATLPARAEAGVRRLAVLVGANTGVGDDITLRFAERDAERMAEVLEELGDVSAEDVVVLRGPRSTRLREVLATLSVRAASAREDGDATVLFVYYSGHADASALRLAGTQLPMSELTGLLEAVPVDVRVLVVDACQSGSLTRLKGAAPTEPFTIRADERLDSEGLAIITSSSAGEDAQESDRLRGGVFTHHFVGGLVGAADASRDGRVTLREAYHYAYNQTIRATSEARFVQHPSYAFRLRGSDDLVLTRTDDPGRSGLLALEEPGEYLVFGDGPGEMLVHEIAVEEGAMLTLAPGTYLVRQRGPAVVREAVVTVRRGETTPLPERDLVALAYGLTVRKGLAPQRRSSVALTMGGGVVGPTVDGTQVAPLATVGVRADLAPLSVGARLHYTPQSTTNALVTMRQHRMGLDLYALKLFDVGRVAPGIGIQAGADWIHQTFTTQGSAPPRHAIAGRVGPIAALDVTLAPRVAIGLRTGVDLLLYSGTTGTTGAPALVTKALPHAALELSAHVF